MIRIPQRSLGVSAVLIYLFHALATSGASTARGTDEKVNPVTDPVGAPDGTLNGVTGRVDSDQIVDLTHAFDERTIYWPTERGFELLRGPAGVTDRGYFYAANRFRAAEHGGTHVDAPFHFFDQRQTVDEIPLDRLMGPGVVIDVAAHCVGNRDYQISVEDLQNWERRHGQELNDVIVLLRTGWSEYWPDRAKYLGTEEYGEEAVAKLHFPGLHPTAAEWMVARRRIKAIGIDTPSIDYGQSQRFASHVKLFEHQIPAFENVAALERLPPSGFKVVALPMKIAGGSGAPLRIVAMIPQAHP